MSMIIKVEGLRAVGENLMEMSRRIQNNISRVSLRAAARVLTIAIKAKSGTTYKPETGLVKRGFSAGVARTKTSGTMQYASVFQRQQKIPTKTAAGRVAAAKFAKRNSRGAVPEKALAYWWRFLEGGTKRGLTARPWIRPAVSAASGEAVEAFRDTMKKRIDQEANSLPSTRGKP